jgi:7,8-dihydropterin-6-yl-methyl-4-(beta-D-ribofuranosyl)aminobenzene 5'-phosphate synthase
MEKVNPSGGAIRAVDGAEIIILVDNTVDILSTTPAGATRSWWEREGMQTTFDTMPLAEHGFAALLRLYSAGQRHTLLFDAGLSGNVALHNAGCFDFDWSEVEAVVLSHGHQDHTGGMPTVLERIGRPALPLLAHPDAFVQRAARTHAGKIVPASPPLDGIALRRLGAELVCTRDTHALFDQALLVMGEIPRQVPFEEGQPTQLRLAGEDWVPDALTWDDRAVVVEVDGEGLVVLAGCAHAGIVNTLLHARAIAGCSDLRAVIGGFHLAGKRFEPRIVPTVAEIEALQPALLVPLHCSGIHAFHAFARALPAATLAGGVLLKLTLGRCG